jgi:hypothetical protein
MVLLMTQTQTLRTGSSIVSGTLTMVGGSLTGTLVTADGETIPVEADFGISLRVATAWWSCDGRKVATALRAVIRALPGRLVLDTRTPVGAGVQTWTLIAPAILKAEQAAAIAAQTAKVVAAVRAEAELDTIPEPSELVYAIWNRVAPLYSGVAVAEWSDAGFEELLVAA